MKTCLISIEMGALSKETCFRSAKAILVLAPEVLRNKGFNRSLDMWSVGVIVYVR